MPSRYHERRCCIWRLMTNSAVTAGLLRVKDGNFKSLGRTPREVQLTLRLAG